MGKKATKTNDGLLLPALRGFDERLDAATAETRVTVFVCGPAVKPLRKGERQCAASAVRWFVSQSIEKADSIAVLGEHRKFQRVSPMQIRPFFSNADRERTFARDSDVDLVVIFPSSPGSLAELGIFALEKEIACKMLVIIDKKLKRSKGFVVQAVIRSAKNRKATVSFMDYRHRRKIWNLIEKHLRNVQSIKVTDAYGKAKRS